MPEPTVIEVAAANLLLSKAASAGPFERGDEIVWTITVTSDGPAAVTGATVTDTIPDGVIDVTWTCSVITGDAACDEASGTGDIDALVDIAPGEQIEFIVTAIVDVAEDAQLSNTADVTPPVGVIDPVPNDNQAVALVEVTREVVAAPTATARSTATATPMPPSATSTPAPTPSATASPTPVPLIAAATSTPAPTGTAVPTATSIVVPLEVIDAGPSELAFSGRTAGITVAFGLGLILAGLALILMGRTGKEPELVIED